MRAAGTQTRADSFRTTQLVDSRVILHDSLASASKDDNTVAWYPNSGGGSFPRKVTISDEALGAYSLIAHDVDQDGWMDLVVASNADDTVAVHRNTDGLGNFVRTPLPAHGPPCSILRPHA